MYLCFDQFQISLFHLAEFVIKTFQYLLVDCSCLVKSFGGFEKDLRNQKPDCSSHKCHRHRNGN